MFYLQKYENAFDELWLFFPPTHKHYILTTLQYWQMMELKKMLHNVGNIFVQTANWINK